MLFDHFKNKYALARTNFRLDDNDLFINSPDPNIVLDICNSEFTASCLDNMRLNNITTQSELWEEQQKNFHSGFPYLRKSSVP